MKTLFAWLALGCCACAQDAPTLTEVLASWREAVQLDLPGELLRGEAQQLEQLPALRTHGEALDLRVTARLLGGDSRGASAILADAKVGAEQEKYATLARARIALFEDQFDEVSKLLRAAESPEVVARCSDLSDAWLLLGRANARAGKNADAAFLFHEFIRRDPFHPESPSAWHFLSAHAARQQNATSAKQYAVAAKQATEWQAYYRARRIQVRENPEATLPRIGLVILWMQADRPQAAKEELARVLALDPKHCEAFGHLAEAERKLENFSEARAAYDKALECAPGKVGLRFNRAYLAGLQGRDGDARADYEWIVQSEHESDPRFQTAHLELARILLAAGEAEGSARHYERYVELGGALPLEK